MPVKAPLESAFKKKVVKRLKAIEGLFFLVKEAASLRGHPDIIGCYKGKFFGFELKRSESEARKNSPRHALQKYRLSQIIEAQGISGFVYPENLEEKLNELIQQ